MNLGELHDEFEFYSGRTDLSDARKTFLINSGQKFLDRLVTTRDSAGKVIQLANVDDWYLLFKRSRSIDSVFMSSDDDRWELEKKDLGWLMLRYNEPIADVDTGKPLYYATPILRSVPQDTGAITISKFIGETVQANHELFGYNGIIWMPPTNEKLVVEVHGLFYSEEFSVDADKSVWSESYPFILLLSAFRSLEILYRNTEGVNDWTRAIMEELDTLGKDFVAEDIVGSLEMGD